MSSTYFIYICVPRLLCALPPFVPRLCGYALPPPPTTTPCQLMQMLLLIYLCSPRMRIRKRMRTKIYIMLLAIFQCEATFCGCANAVWLPFAHAHYTFDDRSAATSDIRQKGQTTLLRKETHIQPNPFTFHGCQFLTPF